MGKTTDEEIEEILDESGQASMAGEGKVIAKRAPNFTLADQGGAPFTLSDGYAKSTLLLVFYPKDFTAVCTKQLCNYRDSILDFLDLGIEIVGVSSNSVDEHFEFAEKYHFPFKLLSDPGSHVARVYACTSIWMLGRISRAVFIVSTKGIILYRYIEPTIVTKRSAKELLQVVRDLRGHGLL